MNRVSLRPILKKTPYELWKYGKPNIFYFKVYGCKYFILNTKDNLGKFDAKTDIGVFLGYSFTNKAYRVFNKRTLAVEESIHVIFDETLPKVETSLEDDDMCENFQKISLNNPLVQESPSSPQPGEDPPSEDGPPPELPKEWRYAKSYPPEAIMESPSHGISTISSLKNVCNFHAFLSQLEPKSFLEAKSNESWMMAM